MQEMDRDSVDQYFEFIEKNILKGGIFLFKNNFGHASDSILAPSEYPFDEDWKLRSATINYAAESCSYFGEFLCLILERTKAANPKKNLQLALRFLWNSFQCRQLQRSTIDIRKINHSILN